MIVTADCNCIVQSPQAAHHWLELDEHYVLVSLNNFIRVLGACMDNPDPITNLSSSMHMPPACSGCSALSSDINTFVEIRHWLSLVPTRPGNEANTGYAPGEQ